MIDVRDPQRQTFYAPPKASLHPPPPPPPAHPWANYTPGTAGGSSGSKHAAPAVPAQAKEIPAKKKTRRGTRPRSSEAEDKRVQRRLDIALETAKRICACPAWGTHYSDCPQHPNAPPPAAEPAGPPAPPPIPPKEEQPTPPWKCKICEGNGVTFWVNETNQAKHALGHENQEKRTWKEKATQPQPRPQQQQQQVIPQPLGGLGGLGGMRKPSLFEVFL